MDLPSTEGLIRHGVAGIDFIPASLRLSRAETMMAQAMFREQVLRDILEITVPDKYDYLLIECNPSMGVLLTNALVAAHWVLIPVQTEEFSLDGLEDMVDLIAMIKKSSNPKLEIIGLLPTLTTRTKGSAEVIRWLQDGYPALVLKTEIGRYADAPKSVAARKPVIGRKSKLGEQYMAATRELLARVEG